MSTITATRTPITLAGPASASHSKRDVQRQEAGASAPRSIGQILRVGIPLGIAAVFALTVVMMVVGGQPLGEAVGIGAYLSFWIGGGFGAIMSGAYYDHQSGGLAHQ